MLNKVLGSIKNKTHKIMATAKRTQAPEKGDFKKQLGIAKKEGSFQQTIERMQIALATNEFSEDRRTKRSNAVLLAIRKREKAMLDNKVKPLSDYGMLMRIYNEDLATVNEAQLAKEADNEIKRFLNKAQGKVTEPQKKIISDYYTARVTRIQDDITAVQILLIEKGLLAGKKPVLQKESVSIPQAVAV